MEDKKIQIFDEFLLPNSNHLVIVKGNRGGGLVAYLKSVIIRQNAYIKQLEKALDKACCELSLRYDIGEDYDKKGAWSTSEWKEWCMKDAD